jgi:hypothetical protein
MLRVVPLVKVVADGIVYLSADVGGCQIARQSFSEMRFSVVIFAVDLPVRPLDTGAERILWGAHDVW